MISNDAFMVDGDVLMAGGDDVIVVDGDNDVLMQ